MGVTSSLSRRVAALCVCLAAPACTLLYGTDVLVAGDNASTDGGGDGGTRGDGADAGQPLDGTPSADGAAPDVECPISTGANACAGIPHFKGTQTVDGRGDEFCDFIATAFDVSHGEMLQGDAGGTNTQALVRVGWSDVGLHFHARVMQARVAPPMGGSQIFQGDTVEVFASASSSLDGGYGPGQDPALQALVAAPVEGQPPVSEQATSATGATVALDPTQCAARLVPGGYEVELALPWSVIAGRAIVPPPAGSRIGFDVLVDVQGLDGMRLFQSYLSYNLPPSPSPCPTPLASTPEAFCDDRTWCTPILDP
jgi:hypothetical protein